MYTFLIKPTNNCNLRCRYCFIDNDIKSEKTVMSLDNAKYIIDQIVSFVENEKHERCKLLWHGGEPLLWGVDNYEAIFSYIEHTHNHIQWEYSIQTNLTLINESYLTVFKKNNVGIGASMDGYKELHNKNRVFLNGKGSYDKLVEKILLARKNGVDIGVIVVVNSTNVKHLIEIYDFFKKNKIGFQLNPLMSIGEASKNNLFVSMEEYEKALIELFDYWINDSDAAPIGNFIEIASSLKTGITSSCIFSQNCQQSLTVIEPNGDILPCDRFCGNNKYVYGNIFISNLDDIMKLKEHEFKKRSYIIRNETCKECRFVSICNGGCPADNNIDLKEKSSFCEVYRNVFMHINNVVSNYHFENELINL